ncbi:MAG: RNA polymerase factor sigma-54 [Phycisphaerales bacterium JB043]
MRFETSQQMKLGQQMKLAPRMIQSMEILQLALPALQERIEQELESNITLELIEPTREGAQPTSEDETSGTVRELDIGDESHDFERLDAFESSYTEAAENEYGSTSSKRFADLETGRARVASGERDAKMDAMANTAARGESMTEQLLKQWGLSELDDRVTALGELIIAALDPDGYLRTEVETLIDQAPPVLAPIAADEMEEALIAVQHVLEPAGIAARDTRECLLLQLHAMEEQADDVDLGFVQALIEDHLDDLLQNRLPRIADALDVEVQRISEAISWMHRLDPSPGRTLAPDEPSVIIPDAIVEYDEEENRYIAYLNDRVLPNLRINREYAKMVRERDTEASTKDFIKTNITNAEWLIDAIEQRKRTLVRVLNVVAEAQRDFFDEGPESLRPLPMTQVADQLGIHVATVSRAVSGKHIETPRGVFPLRRFFSGGTQTESGDEVSWDAIKAALQDVIAGEDTSAPLSDEALSRAMKERGIEIARRTVAKYRTQLGIPSARMRKTFS